MKISLEPEFSGGRDIYQNSCNLKYFSAVIVPFLCASIFFILLKRESTKSKFFCSQLLNPTKWNSEKGS
jgi:hypothetical protein